MLHFYGVTAGRGKISANQSNSVDCGGWVDAFMHAEPLGVTPSDVVRRARWAGLGHIQHFVPSHESGARWN